MTVVDETARVVAMGHLVCDDFAVPEPGGERFTTTVKFVGEPPPKQKESQ